MQSDDKSRMGYPPEAIQRFVDHPPTPISVSQGVQHVAGCRKEILVATGKSAVPQLRLFAVLFGKLENRSFFDI